MATNEIFAETFTDVVEGVTEIVVRVACVGVGVLTFWPGCRALQEISGKERRLRIQFAHLRGTVIPPSHTRCSSLFAEYWVYCQ